MKFFNFYQNFTKNKRGFTLIEAAIIMPVIVFFAFGVLEAAIAIQQKSAVTRAAKAIGASLQENPNRTVDANLWSGLGGRLFDFSVGGKNCVCATVHATAAEAGNAGSGRGCPCTSDNHSMPLVRPFFLAVSASATMPAATGIGGALFGNTRVLQSHTVLSFPAGQQDCYFIHTATLMQPQGDDETGFFIREIKYSRPWGYGGSGTPSLTNPFSTMTGTSSSTGGHRWCPKGTLVTGVRIDLGDENWQNGNADDQWPNQGVAEVTCLTSWPLKMELCAMGNKTSRPWWNPKADAEMDGIIRKINNIQ